MQNRREFLKQASLLLAGGLVAPQLLTSCGGKGASSAASETAKNTLVFNFTLYVMTLMIWVSRKYWKSFPKWVM